MKRLLIAFFLIAVFSCPRYTSAADAAHPDIDIPSSIEVIKKDDLTLQTLVELFGEPFKEIAGTPSNTSVLKSQYANLFIGILGVLNFLSMIYVGASAVYLWVIFAATTAHDGERLGSGVYNSLWVPLRQAGAFGLTVPISHGLSVMQILIIACVSMSINFANTIWDTASKYMLDHANLGLIETSVPVSSETLYRALPMMFRDAVLQQIDLSIINDKNDIFPSKANKDDDKGVAYWPTNFMAVKKNKPLNIDNLPTESSDGKLMFFLDRQQGLAKLRIRTTTNMNPNDVGTIYISYPTGTNKKESFSYDLKEKIANIEINYFSALYGEVYKAAKVYLNSRASSGSDSGCGIAVNNQCLPATEAEKAIENLMEFASQLTTQMNKDISEKVKQSFDKKNKEVLKNIVSKSLDLQNGESQSGWATAGLFNLSLSVLQSEFNNSVNSTITSTPGDVISKSNTNVLKNFKKILKDTNKVTALERASEYFNAVAVKTDDYSASFLQNTYNEDGQVDGGLGTIQKTIVTSFAGENIQQQATYSGILGIVLNELGKYDPIVVMGNFGSKIFDAMTHPTFWAGSVLSGATIGTTFTVMAIVLLLSISCFFCYVVPIIPFIFWMYALVSWMFMVIESLVAAPFWVCTHVMPEGDGIVGDRARKGYLLLLELISRPALLVVGAVFAVAMCQIIGWMIQQLLSYWFGNLATNFISISFFGDMVYTILILSLVYYIYYTVFTKGILYMPEKALAWCGAGSGMGLQNSEDTLKSTLVAGGALSVGGTAMIAGNVTGKAVQRLHALKNRGLGSGKKGLGNKVDEGKGVITEGTAIPESSSGDAPVMKKPVAQISKKTSSASSGKKPNTGSGSAALKKPQSGIARRTSPAEDILPSVEKNMQTMMDTEALQQGLADLKPDAKISRQGTIDSLTGNIN